MPARSHAAQRDTVTAGVIGLGMIGGGVARNIAAAGLPLTVYDIRPDAADGLDGVAAPLGSPADVARASDVVLISVVDAGQVREVLDGEGGLLGAGKPGLVVLLLSTVALSAVREFAALCAGQGATLLDAGVTQAGDGLLVSMVGGPTDVVERVRPVLDAFSKAVVHCGPVGSGMVTKIARNVVTYASWAVVREATGMAVRAGVDPERLIEVLDKAETGGTSPLFLLRDHLDTQGVIRRQAAYIEALAQKDLSAAQELGREIGLATPVVDTVRPWMSAVLEGKYEGTATGSTHRKTGGHDS
ncbi:NAD(P)-dependent oxidoreductase (plasmid) [Streptomyces sp. NBC_01450]|uniref:NAD(P)-dependent oxidoreductase n=1 Tax=Streptomyces sp. NBC_01450 TaxID=2903871 RepID=UPI002E32C6A3|nr:NAD(P)-dependent oxidoreductase [Streptomyces sp. NBC_01450]